MSRHYINDIESICLGCKGNKWERQLVLDRYEIIRCEKCGLGQTYPFPFGQQQTKVNQDVYTLQNRLDAYHNRFKELSKRYERQLTEIKEHSSSPVANLLVSILKSSNRSCGLNSRLYYMS